jgi:tetratricopeptide (TPR) repeat protein
MSDEAGKKPTVFISYSHKDEEWKDRLRPHLKMLEQAGRIRIWDDRDIDAGAQWYNDIMQAMDSAAVAVCLISADFLASDFCTKEEIPYLLERRERDGMLLLPILVRPCAWKVAAWLEKTQMLPRDGKSVTKDFKGNEDEVFALVAETIFDKLDNPNYQPPAPPPPRWSPPERVEINRLPMTGAELFGRQRELEMLDEAWASDSTHVVSLVAWGGVGKSTLVKKWLERLAADNYRGARRVYAWSFYSQGTSERVTSADLFINDALTWFGDADPTLGSPWDKGERLAKLVREEKTLLLLDGMEPLQSSLAYERGKIKDPALSTLLTELARSNPGLCVITTREAVTDLAKFSDTVLHKDLEQISDEAGRALLRVGGVQGTDAELEQATRDFGNHALAINLLAVYLRDVPGHGVSHAAAIPDLDIPEAAGRHPRRLMAAFARRFDDGPEVELLRLLGLFDRPADSKALESLRAAPPIPGLTDRLHLLSEADWLRLIEKLRRLKLIAPAGHHWLTDLDAHPLLREHFGEELKQQHPSAWREGNNRLYEHLRDTAKELPDTLEEMAPLYAAITHGCAAGRYDETLDQIYWRRVQRKSQYFSLKTLGAIGADTAALANFFDRLWDKPAEGISTKGQSFLLDQAGEALHALGRLTEALKAVRVLFDTGVRRGNGGDAVKAAITLSELSLTMGNLEAAVYYGKESIQYADRKPGLFHRQVSRSTLADALHQLGKYDEAAQWFSEAEAIERVRRPEEPLLSSVQGYAYCEFLFGKGADRDVEVRTKRTLQWANKDCSLLAIALDHLSMGRVHLLQARREGGGNFTEAENHLRRAVDGLRQAGTLNFLPRGLLARAELYRAKGEFEWAQADLDEAMSIAKLGSMGLHEADCYLEYARLYLARGEKGQARESWTQAREMIKCMGYHRRDKEVEEIGQELGEAVDE